MADNPQAPAETITVIGAFLSAHVRNAEIGPSDNIFETGLVNSLFALQLVNFIENRFGLTIPDEELILENFHSIEAMASFVERMQPGPA